MATNYPTNALICGWINHSQVLIDPLLYLPNMMLSAGGKQEEYNA